jgi:hypothetical protein
MGTLREVGPGAHWTIPTAFETTSRHFLVACPERLEVEGVIKTSFLELLESACVRPHLPANLSNLFGLDTIRRKIQL